jgi:hypothetical protein
MIAFIKPLLTRRSECRAGPPIGHPGQLPIAVRLSPERDYSSEELLELGREIGWCRKP